MDIIFYKTMEHFFPSFLNWLKQINDPRNELMIDYPLPSVLWVGILLFALKIETRRQVDFQFNTPGFISNLNYLSKTDLDKMMNNGTLNYSLKKLPLEYLSDLRVKMIKRIIRSRCLEKFRLGLHYQIAIDGTGQLVFHERHCEHCLVKKRDGKALYYYHNVLEAKLVTSNGLALSLATEFIENPPEPYDKQDCELKAFYRLAKTLKRDFPQLNICLLLDALYAAEPVFDICKNNNWKYLITFKEGSMPATYEEYEALKKLQFENKTTVKIEKEGIVQHYNWVRDIDYNGNHLLHVLECNELKPDKDGNNGNTRFAWLTNLDIGRHNFKSTAKAGRCRWKVENEGFNIQKNGGYNLEHAYSEDELAGKNFYVLLQIAHIINQLMEKGSLLKDQIQKVYGSIRNIARKLLEDFRTKPVDKEYLESIFSGPFQIRFEWSFDTS